MAEILDMGRNFVKNVIRRPMFYFCFAFIILNLFFTKQILEKNEIGNFWLIAIVEICIELSLIFALYRLRKKGAPLEKQFLLVSVVLGVLFIVFLPPGQSPDDVTHFRRAYGISDGSLLPDVVDNNVITDIPVEVNNMPIMPSPGVYDRLFDNVDKNSGEKSEQPYISAALYNFICYMPQVLAIWFGKLVGLPILMVGYLVEIFNFIVWIFLVYYAIKIIPKFKAVIIFLALLPITLQEATSMSPDALTIGLSMFLIAFVLYLSYGKVGMMRRRELAILYVTAVVIGLCKIVYLPLVALYMVIPFKKFGSKKKKWINLLIIFAMVAIINIVWLMLSSRYLIEYNQGVNSAMQLMGILDSPIGYIKVILGTLNVHMQFWLSSMLGLSLGAFVFNLPTVLLFASLSFLLVLMLQEDEKINIKLFDRLIFGGTFVTIFGLILTSLYMQWTPVGYETIEGVQGRYFLPILLLLPVVVRKNNNKTSKSIIISDKTVILYSVFINVIAYVTIFAQNV